MKTIFLSVLSSLFLFAALAQQPLPPNPPPPPPADEGEMMPPPEESENARFYLAYKMKERLGLTEAQTLRVLDVLKEGDAFRLAHREKMRLLKKAAVDLLQNPKATDQEYKKMADEMKKMKNDAEAKMEEMDGKLFAIFTPKQQLQWVLFKKDMPKNMGPGQGREGRPPGERGPKNH